MKNSNTLWDKVFRLLLVVSIPTIILSSVFLFEAITEHSDYSDIEWVKRVYDVNLESAKEIAFTHRLRANKAMDIAGLALISTPILFLIFYIMHFVVVGSFRYKIPFKKFTGIRGKDCNTE